MYQQIPVSSPTQWTVPAGVTSVSAFAATGNMAIPGGPPGPPPPPNTPGAYGAALNLAINPGDVFDIAPGGPLNRGDITISKAGVVLASSRNGQNIPSGTATFVW